MDSALPCVVDGLPKPRTFDGHRAPVEMFVTIDDLAQIAGCEIAAVDLSKAVLGRWFTDLHVHSRDEIYLSVEPGGIEVEAAVGVRHFTCISPFAIHIPAGTPHKFRPLYVRPGQRAYLLGLFPVSQGEPNER